MGELLPIASTDRKGLMSEDSFSRMPVFLKHNNAGHRILKFTLSRGVDNQQTQELYKIYHFNYIANSTEVTYLFRYHNSVKLEVKKKGPANIYVDSDGYIYVKQLLGYTIAIVPIVSLKGVKITVMSDDILSTLTEVTE